MSTKEEMKKRQERVQIALAKDPTLTYSDLADRFSVSKSTIKRDIRDIKDRNRGKIEEEPLEMVLFEMSTQMKALLKEYWESYKEFDSETSKIGALNGARDLLKDRIRLLQRLGIIHEEPRHVKNEITGSKSEEILEEIREKADKLDEEGLLPDFLQEDLDDDGGQVEELEADIIDS